MKKASVKQIGLLLLTAMIWGGAFVAQSVGLDYVGPFTINAVRFLIGGLVLLPGIALLEHFQAKRGEVRQRGSARDLLLGGLCCGLALCVATNLQQIGIAYTTVGKAGFLTALYVVIVPFLGLFFGKRLPPVIWVCVALALAGLYLLCMTGTEGLGKGDLLVLLCALAFSVHILVVDHFSSRVDPVRLSCVQFLVSGLVAAVPMAVLEQPTVAAVVSAWQPILYAGVLSCGVAYTLQAVAQRDCDPTVCSLVLCLESVFSLLFGWLLLGQGLTLREWLGCVLMFAAIVLAQLPQKARKPKPAPKAAAPLPGESK